MFNLDHLTPALLALIVAELQEHDPEDAGVAASYQAACQAIDNNCGGETAAVLITNADKFMETIQRLVLP